MSGKKMKIVSCLMAAILCVPCVTFNGTVNCYAQEQDLSTFSMSGDWAYGTFGSSDQYVYIGGYAGTDTILEIPDEIEGKTVKQIFQNAFCDKTGLESVSIPGSVEMIEDGAFSGCTSLTTVSFRESETGTDTFTIGAEAFMNCTSLETFVFPDNTKTIGDSAFYGCIGLTELNLPKDVTGIGKYAFSKCNGITEITVPSNVNLDLAGQWVFSECANLHSVVLEDGLADISEGMFAGCTSLEQITIPDSVTTIGVSAFQGCDRLSDLTIPNSVVTVGDYSFYACESLQQIVIPDSVTFIGECAFAYCSNLSQVVLSANLQSIGSESFLECISLDNVVIPEGTKTIGSRAFQGCSNLTEIHIPASVADIFENALYLCSENITVYTTEDATAVILYAKYEQDSPIPLIYGEKEEVPYLTEGDWRYRVKDDGSAEILRYTGESTNDEVLIPDTLGGYPVTEIGAYTFLRNSDIRKVTIPQGVTTIGDSAFNSCVSIKVQIPKSVTSISSSAFSGCDSLTVYMEHGADEVISYLTEEGIPYVISVTEISFSEGTLSIPEDEIATVNVMITPTSASNQNLEWSSSNEEVAEVYSDGMIVAKKVGTATITVSATDGFTGEPVIASFVVTVTEATDEDEEEPDEPSSNPGTGSTPTGGTDSPGTGSTPTGGTDNGSATTDSTGSAKATVPAAPKISSLTAKTNGITVKWSKVKKASGYYVYRRTGKGSWKKVATIKKSATTSYTDKNAAKNGTTYQYKIYAYTTSGKTTTKSKASAAKTMIYLKAPKLSSVTNNKAKSATVKYGKNAKASGYEICCSTSSKFAKGNITKKVSSAKTVKKVLSSLMKGRTYYIRVRACTKSGKTTYYSAWSDSKSVKITK